MTAICRRLLQGQLARFRNLGQLRWLCHREKSERESGLHPSIEPGWVQLAAIAWMQKPSKKEVKMATIRLVEPPGCLSSTNLRPDPAYAPAVAAAATADGQAGPNSEKVQINVGASGSDRCQGRYVTQVTDQVLFVFPRVIDRRSCSSEAEFLTAVASGCQRRTRRHVCNVIQNGIFSLDGLGTTVLRRCDLPVLARMLLQDSRLPGDHGCQSASRRWD